MKRRTFLGLLGSGSALAAGCLSTPGASGSGPGTGARSPAGARTSARARASTRTPAPEKPGTVDNHRITAVEAVSHDARRRTDADGHEWVVTVTLRLKPQDPEVATVYPVGVFFLFFDADGKRIYRVYETVPANTGSASRTVTLSAPFDPAKATADAFHRYRVDLVHP